MKEEEYLIKSVGKRNPFTVPEGYFESLTSQVMARVDAEGAQLHSAKKAKSIWLRPLLYAAACICALFISVLPYMAHQDQPAVASASIPAATIQDDAFDEAADYVMFDNQDIYACLSSEY